MSNTFPAGIVLVTKNREQDLRRVLDTLAQLPHWGTLPIWCLDDASDQVSAGYFEFLQKRCYGLLRHTKSEGVIVSRNRAYAEAPFDIIYSLDDDSCFANDQGLEESLAYFREHPKVAALSFPINKRAIKPPFPCAIFQACADVVRKEAFLAAGGYREDFFHQGEETELAWRFWAMGYEIHAFPQCQVDHWETRASRSFYKMGYYGPRNRMRTLFWFAPARYLLLQMLRIIGSYAKISLKTGLPHVHLAGLIMGILQGIVNFPRRKPLSPDLYLKLIHLPQTADEMEVGL